MKKKNIVDPTQYKTSVSQYELGYIVFFKSKKEGRVPSFGTVAVDFCGKVVTVTAPL